MNVVSNEGTAIGRGKAPLPDGAMLFVDATGTLLSYGSTPTGIPRIEDFLVRAALADPDPAVAVVRFERRQRKYRRLNPLERQQLSGPPPSINVDSESASRAEILSQVFKIIRKNPTIGREADRHFADLIAKNGRRGYFYAGAKLLFRAYRVYRRCLAILVLSHSATIREPFDPGHGIVLMSNVVIFGSLMSRAFSATKHRAFICHDLIPVLHPEFAIDSDHAKRFSENLGRAVKSNVAAICTSDSSSSMLSEYLRSFRGLAPASIAFPCPRSCTNERALTARHAARLPSRSSFIALLLRDGRTTSCLRAFGSRHSRKAWPCRDLFALENGDGALTR